MTFSSLLSIRSHPVRVRGLKRMSARVSPSAAKSHPVRVRGLKPEQLVVQIALMVSHPVRVRGLKQRTRSPKK